MDFYRPPEVHGATAAPRPRPSRPARHGIGRAKEIAELGKGILLGRFGQGRAGVGDKTGTFQRQPHVGMLLVYSTAVSLIHDTKVSRSA